MSDRASQRVEVIAKEIWRYNECPWDFDNPPEGMAQLQKQISIDQAGNIIRVLADSATQFAWVIENGSGSDLRYYAPTQPGEWTRDHLKACRFARKEDAEAVQFRHVQHCDFPVHDTRVCEHGWG